MKYLKFLVIIFLTTLTGNGSAFSTTLKVGLYPFVPRVDQFKAVLEEKWSKLNTGIELEIVTDMAIWDGGYNTDPNGLDVFVFDALFLNKYRKRNSLEPLTPDDINPAGLDDFLPYAIEGVKNSDGSTYAAIPLLGCTNVLFYKSSLDLADVNTFDGVRDIVKSCQFTGLIPGQVQNNGMMLDISGSTTNASYYLATQYAMEGIYPFPVPSSINADVTDRMRTLMEMSSYPNATNGNLESYQRGIWFGEGYGNSFVGFTESMWGIANANNNELPSDFEFKPLPLWNDGETNNPVFYADVIGVSSTSNDIANAKKLAALMGSTDVVVASTTGIGQSGGVPQYLLLTLKSAFDTLAKTYPVYSKMEEMAINPNIKMFTLSDELYEWFENNKSTIRTETRTGFICGCDKASDVNLTSANAQSVCPSVCETQGGWNGQWTTASPFVSTSTSGVCGCNSCAIP